MVVCWVEAYCTYFQVLKTQLSSVVEQQQPYYGVLCKLFICQLCEVLPVSKASFQYCVGVHQVAIYPAGAWG
jgi:hypothetical protein